MEFKLHLADPAELIDIDAMGSFIAGLQRENGEIPWSKGGKTDPWDHVESAMGLAVAGRITEAQRAYRWMAETQLPDGSWWSATRDGRPEDKTRESHFASYFAVGLFHYHLITCDDALLSSLWPNMEAGIGYALSLQAENGVIYWAKNAEGLVDPMALLTGSSSIFLSLNCAIAIASLLGRSRRDWIMARERLGEAICHRPGLFNMMKARYAMDWYYPVLCGALTGSMARERIDRSWDKFVYPEWGVRCVCDQPWVTMAETSELVLTLLSMGDRHRAQILFQWIYDKKYTDGSYWMGVTFPEGIIWPDERTSWTTAAILLAYDALYQSTPGCRLFSHRSWQDAGLQGQKAGPSSP